MPIEVIICVNTMVAVEQEVKYPRKHDNIFILKTFKYFDDQVISKTIILTYNYSKGECVGN